MNNLHYAVVVGIDRYPGIGDLSGARADAHAFAAWLVADEGGQLPGNNVKRVTVTDTEERGFTSARDARPTHLQIDYALQEVSEAIRAQLSTDLDLWGRTRLYLYVAGHGLAPQGGEGALFLANAEPGALSRNIELPEYRRWCSACAWFREVVVFADCCRTRISDGPRGFGPQLDECWQPYVDEETTWVVGFGAALGKPTYEMPSPGSDDEARGYFTRALLEGLGGGAADPVSGVVTAAALAGFVKQAVAEMTKDRPYPQTAQFPGELGSPIVLSAAVAARPRRTVILNFPPGFTGRVALRRSDLVAFGSWDAVDGPWQIELEDGYYEVGPEPAQPRTQFRDDGLFKVIGKDTDVQL